MIQSGRLKGLLDVRDQTIPSLQASLDTLASELVTQVNQQHRLGFGLDGSTNQNLFAPTGTTANTIAVSLTNVRQFAASSTAAGVPGNNANALALAGLRSTDFTWLGNVTFQEYYSTIAGNFGSTAQGVESNLQCATDSSRSIDVSTGVYIGCIDGRRARQPPSVSTEF